MKVLNEENPKVEYQTKISNIVPTNERAVEKLMVTNEKNMTLKSKKDTDLSSLLKRKSDRQQTITYARKYLSWESITALCDRNCLSYMIARLSVLRKTIISLHWWLFKAIFSSKLLVVKSTCQLWLCWVFWWSIGYCFPFFAFLFASQILFA